MFEFKTIRGTAPQGNYPQALRKQHEQDNSATPVHSYYFGPGGLALTANVADSLGFSDSLGFEAGRATSVADSISFTDSIAFERAISIADAVSIADAISFQFDLNIADTLAMADAIDPVRTGALQHEVSVNDTLSLADALSFIRDVNLLLEETLLVRDSNARQLNGLFLSDGSVAVQAGNKIIVIGRF